MTGAPFVRHDHCRFARARRRATASRLHRRRHRRLVAMIAAILGSSLWFLNFVHVMAGSLWTGIDLFMGFVIGPVLRKVALDTRRAMIAGIIPRTLILMPTLSAITSTAGWFLAVRLGFLDLGYPQFWWVIAALAIVSVLTVQGLGYLLPMNLKLYFEIQKPAPDPAKLQALDAHLCARSRRPGRDAGRHHRRDGALRHRVLAPACRLPTRSTTAISTTMSRATCIASAASRSRRTRSSRSPSSMIRRVSIPTRRRPKRPSSAASSPAAGTPAG